MKDYFNDLENIIRIALHLQANPIPVEGVIQRARVRNALHELTEALQTDWLPRERTITYAQNFVQRNI